MKGRERQPMNMEVLTCLQSMISFFFSADRPDGINISDDGGDGGEVLHRVPPVLPDLALVVVKDLRRADRDLRLSVQHSQVLRVIRGFQRPRELQTRLHLPRQRQELWCRLGSRSQSGWSEPISQRISTGWVQEHTHTHTKKRVCMQECVWKCRLLGKSNFLSRQTTFRTLFFLYLQYHKCTNFLWKEKLIFLKLWIV